MPALHGGGSRYIEEKSDNKDAVMYGEKGARRFRLYGETGPLDDNVLFLTTEPDEETRSRGADIAGVIPKIRSGRMDTMVAKYSQRRDHDAFNRDEVSLYQWILEPDKGAEGNSGPGQNTLSNLALALTGQPPSQAGRQLRGENVPQPPPSTKPALPAAYTYFGQFLAHDMSNMKWSDKIGDSGGWENGQHLHALNFDTLFGLSKDSVPLSNNPLAAYDTWIGRDTIGRAADLPRSGPEGRPRCVDPRSDTNLGLAQLTVLLMRFHQQTALALGCSCTKAKEVTRRHLQAVVLTDYLKRLVPREVYQSVMRDGRALVATTHGDPFEIPIEFAAACFRMGHSMVRERYKPWFPHDLGHSNEIGSVAKLLGFTHRGGGLKDGLMRANWVQSWRHGTGGLGEFGDEALDAASIDTDIAIDLGDLPKRLFEARSGENLPDTLSLANRTLELGARLGLPSGQRLYRHIKDQDIAMLPMLDIRRFLEDRAHRFGALHGDIMVCEETPLWFYTLAEAELNSGPGLGHVAGRVVMETFHAAIEKAENSILSRVGGGGTRINFQRKLRKGCGPEARFSLPDLVAVAGLPH